MVGFLCAFRGSGLPLLEIGSPVPKLAVSSRCLRSVLALLDASSCGPVAASRLCGCDWVPEGVSGGKRKTKSKTKFSAVHLCLFSFAKRRMHIFRGETYSDGQSACIPPNLEDLIFSIIYAESQGKRKYIINTASQVALANLEK